ncbi:M13 family metallopeptidase [Nocardia sp. XZ_19_385]|uniref:M13 family metallopeptidase n=1 Tax=Nocardia sp. XZ_19_385 TaxID=2769488 RepID=UPI00188E7DE9|nr:M13 family metallopeptidase [Nocardia sp. XZ_19_385]
MNTSGRLSDLDRRSFLIGLGLLPALAACERTQAPKRLAAPDMAGSDPRVEPQDDLYRYVNGRWLDDYQLPPDKVSFGTFAEVSDRTENQLRDLIDDIRNPKAGTEGQQVRDLYDAVMDTRAIDEQGLTPLTDLFARIDAAGSKADLAEVMGALPMDGLIGLEVAPDPKNSAAYVPTIAQSGIGLDEEYYREPEAAEKLAAYRTFLERISTGAGFTDPIPLAHRVLDLETRIAALFWDDVRERDPNATYNPSSWTEFTRTAPGFEWDRWLSGRTDRPKDLFAQVVVREPSFATGAAQLWQDVDIASWRDYLKLGLVRTFAQYLPAEIADARFDFWGTVMEGLQQQPERWKTALGAVNEYLGDQLGKVYVASYFPAEAKQRVQDMVSDLLAAYRADFENSTWMSPATRAAAVVKLNKITTKLGYPDKWPDYSALTITRGKLIESLRAATTFRERRMFDRLGRPVDKAEWEMPPQTVNAYYNPNANEIVFPAAILQPPFFDKDAAPAVNYGAGGAVIGHEIGHGFDDQGFRYDGDGNLHDWWTPEDRAAFDAKTKQLIEQYDALVPTGLSPSQHVNGALTVGENLADLHGLQIALAAVRLAAGRDGSDPALRSVFESWGRTWRTKTTTQALEAQLASDPHSPAEFRCNQTVRNLADFYETFGVVEGDKMWLPPDQRVTL